MFELKKIISAYILPPGIFVLILLIAGISFLFKKKRSAGVFNIVVAIGIWTISISPVSDFLLRGLEADLSIPKQVSVDVIILMGGGSDLEVADLTGIGSPNGDMLARLVTTVRLYKQIKKPIIITSGKVFSNKPSEATVIKRFLVDLGVQEDMIIIEDKSRDTIENARFTKEICVKRGFKKLALVTSAYHMKRSMMSFKRFEMDVIAVPSKFKTSKEQKYYWYDYLPNASNFLDTSTALKEYIGIAFYKLAY